MTRKLEEFKPDDRKLVKVYCCGPTVYDFVHIGNLRSFVFYDVLRRVLEYNGFKVRLVMNITDVDDKTIKKSREAGVELKEYTENYTRYFMEDIKKLNIKPADLYPHATDSIVEMEKIILKLKEDGFAYETDDGIYYEISKFKDYGKLSKTRVGDSTFSRINADEYEKDNLADFALWKAWDKEDGEVYWTGKLPKGRPGWHIECSAMSISNLGPTIDIHSGGIDLIFPHHENEIAQSEAYTGKKFVNYWVHPEHLLVNGKKMSKSLKNFYTLKDLERSGFDPLAFRLLMLDSDHKAKLDFTFEALEKAEKTLDDLDITLKSFAKLKENDRNGPEPEIGLKAFDAAINNDFDTHAGLVEFFRVVDIARARIKEGMVGKREKTKILDAINTMDGVLGILEGYNIPDSIESLSKERSDLRRKKNWNEADAIREKIKKRGFRVIDMVDGSYTIVKNRRV
jgi:cysteinyl-tRNA synthetase